MWFNLQILKKVIQFYKKIVYWRSFLLISKIMQNWKLNTLFFNKQYKYKFTFARKVKKLLEDHKSYFLLQNKFLKFINSVVLYNSAFFYYLYLLLLFNNSKFLILNKYKNLKIKSNILLKKYVSLLKQKKILKNSYIYGLNNIFLLYKNFYLSEKILIYIDLYVFYVEKFFFNFIKLTYFLKNFFLRKCSIKLKLKIWDDCKFTVDNQLVFFKEKSIWLKNLEIFEEENILFFNQIDLDKVFLIWDVFKSKVNNSIDNNFKFLYYKYKMLMDKLIFLIYRIKIIKKKYNNINNFLFFQKLNFNFWKNKKLLKFFNNVVPFLNNRLVLLKLIYNRRKNFKILKKKIFLKINESLNILSLEKKNILYNLYFILFLHFIKKFYLKMDNQFILLKQKLKNIKNFKIKIILNFKLLFSLYYKLKIHLNFENFSKNWEIFLFCFFFFHIEAKLLKNKNLNHLQILQMDALKQYNLKKLDDFLFLNFWKLIVLNFSLEVDNNYTKRYELLHHYLFLKYKKYWFKYNNEAIKILYFLENQIIKKLLNIKFFINNLSIFQKIFEIYQLFSYKFFNLQQYKNLIKTAINLLRMLLKKKKKKFFNNKFYNNANLIFSFLYFLRTKYKKFMFKNNYILMLYFIIKKSFIIKNFIKFFILSRKKNLSLLYLKLFLNIKDVFFFFLEQQRVKNVVNLYKKLTINLIYIYFLNKLKLKKNFKKFKNFKSKYYVLFFLKKKIFKYKKKKNFLITTYNKEVFENLTLKKKDTFLILKINQLNKFLFKNLLLNYSLYFFIKLMEQLYEYFLFIFKNDFVSDLLININIHFLSTITFFDLKNDFNLAKKNFIYKLRGEQRKFFFNNRYKYIKNFWYIIKHNFYLTKLNILINRRLIFIVWFNCINNENIKYKNLEINDYLFVIRMEHKNFDLDYFSTIKLFRSELNFLIQLCLSYFSFIEKNNLFFKNKERTFFNLINRQLKNIDFTLHSINFYLKKKFLTLINLKKKKNKKIYINKKKIITNFYQYNYLYKKKFLNFKILYSTTYKLNTYICKNCTCLFMDKFQVNKIKYYQVFLNLNLIDKNILKFNFSLCTKCNQYKISLNHNEFILSFTTYEDIVKYLIKLKKLNAFIFFNNKIQYCSFYNKTNYLFLNEINLITLNLNNINLKFFFCYFQSKDFYFFNIKLNLYHFNFYNIFIYLIILLLVNIFFIENYYLLLPKLVKIYNDAIILHNLGNFYNKKIENYKLYQKKNHIKMTRKFKKERKLYYLNKFFDEFKIKK